MLEIPYIIFSKSYETFAVYQVYFQAVAKTLELYWLEIFLMHNLKLNKFNLWPIWKKFYYVEKRRKKGILIGKRSSQQLRVTKLAHAYFEMESKQHYSLYLDNFPLLASGSVEWSVKHTGFAIFLYEFESRSHFIFGTKTFFC